MNGISLERAAFGPPSNMFVEPKFASRSSLLTLYGVSWPEVWTCTCLAAGVIFFVGRVRFGGGKELSSLSDDSAMRRFLRRCPRIWLGSVADDVRRVEGEDWEMVSDAEPGCNSQLFSEHLSDPSHA